MGSNTVKLCKDCAHYEGQVVGPDSKWWERCNYPITPIYDYVSGEQTNKYACRDPRQERYEGGAAHRDRCGASGSHFSERTEHRN